MARKPHVFISDYRNAEAIRIHFHADGGNHIECFTGVQAGDRAATWRTLSYREVHLREAMLHRFRDVVGTELRLARRRALYRERMSARAPATDPDLAARSERSR
jgi:hypothetical protein